MEFPCLLAIACILLIYTTPVEQETITKNVEPETTANNEVTPAPPIYLPELIGTKAEALANAPTCDDIKEEGLNIESKSTEITASSPGNVQVIEEKRTNEEFKKKVKVKNQPVCKYGVSEIFLFGEMGDAKCKISSKKDTSVPLKDPDRKDDVIAQSKREDERTDNVIKKEEEAKEDADKRENKPYMKLEVADMKSFEEWKNLKLQEQESRMAEVEPIPTRTVRAKKTQINYASQDCGAKVLAHNKESKHVSAILDENKDMYMLNPCSTNIWFVIELCEPIQVQQLQLGNLELFSSAPKEFSVSVSERYPAREWHTIGTFEATNERNLQTFAAKSEGLMFAKYIKFEMLSHFSNEHFCPLTLVRVLGVTMVDEFDDSEQPHLKEISDTEYTLEANQGVITEETNKKSDGPINTMLNIVKNAIGLNNGAEQLDQHKQDTNANKSEEEIGGNDTEAIDPTVESEVVLVTNETDIAGPTESPSFITLVETGQGEDLSEYIKNLTSRAPKKIPLYIPKFIQYLAPFSKNLNVNVCWFFEFFCKVSFAGCLVHYPYNFSAIGLFIPLSTFTNSTSLNQPAESDTEGSLFSKNVSNSGTVPPQILSRDDEAKNEKEMTDGQMPLAADLDANVQSDVKTALSDSKIDKEEVLDIDVVTQPTSSDGNSVNMHRAIEPSEMPSQEASSVQADGEGKPDEDTENKKQSSESTPTTDNVVMKDDAEAAEIPPTEIPLVNDSATASSIDTMKPTVDSTISAEDQSAQPPVVINPGTNQKDSVFMRLSNRIRALEQDMALSSDYLENLSQRYKKQMDEMQRAFNETTSELLTTSRTANENDARQTELIQQARAKIENLTQQLKNLSVTHDKLNMQLVERHMCLILLEIIIFIAVLVTCIGRRMAQVRGDVERAEAMIERLEQKLWEAQPTFQPPPVPNGHCKSISCESSNQHFAPLLINGIAAKPGKKQKRKRSGQKNASVEGRHKGDNQDFLRQNCKDSSAFGPMEVEEIGGKTKTNTWMMPRGSCTSNKTQNWNGNPISLKIPNGHVKGRK